MATGGALGEARCSLPVGTRRFGVERLLEERRECLEGNGFARYDELLSRRIRGERLVGAAESEGTFGTLASGGGRSQRRLYAESRATPGNDLWGSSSARGMLPSNDGWSSRHLSCSTT